MDNKNHTLTFGMDSSQVGILKERHEVRLGSLLECHHSRGLEAKIGLQSKDQNQIRSSKTPSLP